MATDDSTPKTNTATTANGMFVQLTTDGVPKLHCPACNKALVSLNGYVKHVKKHEPPGGFLCRYCEARFCSDDELKRHRDAVHTTIACRLCKELTFSNEQEYREHIRNVHNGIDRQLYMCEKCGAEYKTIEPYRRHMEMQCGTVKPHKCDQCPMSFVTKYNLKQHRESHTGERKFCCSYCGKDFLQKGRLVEHERSHTGEKPYKCDVCGKCFAHRESIVTHSSIHTGIRLVECRCCASRFSCYSNLIKHRRARPDTCGQPEYDPPKNRVRTHRPRIPPTLNPTSEIKISNVNKIIKPTHKEQKRQQRGKHKSVVQKRKKQADCEEDVDEEEEDEDEVEENDDNCEGDTSHLEAESSAGEEAAMPAKKRQTRAVVAQKQATKQLWNEAESDAEDVDYDPIEDSESETEQLDSKVHIKKEEPNQLATEKVQVLDNAFEYTDANQFVDVAYEVKCEDIFNEKDKLLNSLLNEHVVDMNDECLNQTKNVSESDQNTSNIKSENDVTLITIEAASNVDAEHANADEEYEDFEELETQILEETEIVLIKDEDAHALHEEDVLELKSAPTDELASLDESEDTSSQRPQRRQRTVQAASPAMITRSKVSPNENGTKKKRGRKRKMPLDTSPDDASQKETTNRSTKLSQQELRTRLKLLHKEEKSWSCPYCIKIYHMRKPFEKHLRDDHNRPEDEIRELLKANIAGVTNEDIFKCHICEKIYLVEKRLKAHEQLHGPDGNLIFKCPCYCNVYFASKDEATDHAQTQHRDLLYCEYCKKFMTGHDSLKNHMKNHHMEKGQRNVQRNLVCDKCGKKFSGRTSLTDHVRSNCGREPLYPCPVCGKCLTTAGILKTHMLLHKDETPYQCDKCGKTFKVKAQYKTHIKTRHSDFKPFKCHLCPKEYPYRESLLTHMTVHTGIKRFLCNGCGKRFTCISNLQAHRKVHSETCGLLPLNAKATQYMGVQKGNLLLGAKPEAGLDYIETNTLIAKDVINRDLPMAQVMSFVPDAAPSPPPPLPPSVPSTSMATVPLNYSQQSPPSISLLPTQTGGGIMPMLTIPSHLIGVSHATPYT